MALLQLQYGTGIQRNTGTTYHTTNIFIQNAILIRIVKHTFHHSGKYGLLSELKHLICQHRRHLFGNRTGNHGEHRAACHGQLVRCLQCQIPGIHGKLTSFHDTIDKIKEQRR